MAAPGTEMLGSEMTGGLCERMSEERERVFGILPLVSVPTGAVPSNMSRSFPAPSRIPPNPRGVLGSHFDYYFDYYVVPMLIGC